MKNFFVMIALLFGSNAYATGGFSCDYSKNGIELNLSGVTSWSFQNLIVDAEGFVKSVADDTHNGFTFNYSLSKQNIVQYWNSGHELRFVIYGEDEKGLPIKAVINTTSLDDSKFIGTVDFSFGNDWSKQDSITCFAE